MSPGGIISPSRSVELDNLVMGNPSIEGALLPKRHARDLGRLAFHCAYFAAEAAPCLWVPCQKEFCHVDVGAQNVNQVTPELPDSIRCASPL